MKTLGFKIEITGEDVEALEKVALQMDMSPEDFTAQHVIGPMTNVLQRMFENFRKSSDKIEQLQHLVRETTGDAASLVKQ